MEAEGFPDRQEIGTVAVSGLGEEWEHCTAGCQQAQGNCLFSKHDTGSKVKVKGSQACLFIISFNCSLSLYSSTVFITFSFKRYINFLMFRINKFRIRKKNILLYVSFIKYILRNSPIIQTNEALHKMSLPVKVRQRQLHMRMNVFILTGMFILIFMCPIMTVMASYTFMCHLKAPLSAIRALWTLRTLTWNLDGTSWNIKFNLAQAFVCTPSAWSQLVGTFSRTRCSDYDCLSFPCVSLWPWLKPGSDWMRVLGVTRGRNVFVLGSLWGRHLLVLTNLRLALWVWWVGGRGNGGGGVV